MRFLRLLPIAALALAGACARDTSVETTTRPPLAYVRYINAVPDTFALDFKFIDAVEYSPSFAGQAFRSVNPYQGAAAGARRIRVFPNSSNIAVTQAFLVDTTLNLQADRYYTILHAGFARAGQTPRQRLIVIEDTYPAQGAGIAIRAVHAAAGVGNVDGFVTATNTTPIAGAPAVSNLAYGAASGYAGLAVGQFSLQVAATGTTTALVAGAAPAGRVGTTAENPIGGALVAGSQMSAFVFPRSVAGSAAPQTAAFQAPAITYLVDRQPPRTVP